MKNIFKKNHIIITALAIMIVIAGYLSFTNNDTADDRNVVETEAVDNGDYEEFTGVEGVDVATATDTDTDTTDTDTTDTDTTDTDTTDTDTTDTANEEDTLDTTADETDDSAAESEATDDEDNEETDESDELGDISDEDILTVTDNGELNLEEGVPGEAVLANAASTIDSSYFITNKIEREQVRAKSKATYMDIIDSAEVSAEQKQVAIDGMLELTDIMAKENKAEMLLDAKGFQDSIVFMNDGMVDVVVNADALTDQQLAIIEEVVKDNMGVSVENIDINPVVISE